MKKFFTLLVTLLVGSFSAFAQQKAQSAQTAKVEELRFAQGTLNFMDAPFKVRNCTFSRTGLVQIDVLNGGMQLRINAVEQGTTEMQLQGDTDTRLYRVTVGNNLRQTMQMMTLDFEEVPEVEVSLSGDKLFLRGSISNLSHWRLFHKLLPYYGGNIVNLVTFQPKTEMMMLLKQELEKEGYILVRSGLPTKHGEIAINPMGDVMTITGTVYSPADITKLNQIINAQNWISTEATDAQRVRAVMNVTVVPELLEISAVFVGVEKTFAKNIGNNFFESGIPIKGNINWGGSTDDNFHNWSDGGSFTISANMGIALRMFGSDEHSVFRRAGFLTFKSNDTTARTLHDGGTLKVRVSGMNSGSLTDVTYGFQVSITGGLTGKDRVYMDINVTLSAPTAQANGDYDVKEQSINTAVYCKLDETVALGGLQDIVRGTVGPSGLPFMRNVPLVNWLFATTDEGLAEKQSLILISPRLMSQAKQIEIPPSQELHDVPDAVKDYYYKGKKESRRWYEFFRW